jgi:hypothetical protein
VYNERTPRSKVLARTRVKSSGQYAAEYWHLHYRKQDSKEEENAAGI